MAEPFFHGIPESLLPSRAMTADHAPEPVLPEVDMHLVMPGDPVTGRIVANRNCMKGKSASYVRHIEIDVSGTPLEGRFKVGQAFGVLAPGVDEHGNPHAVRLFSIASPSQGECGEGRVISTTCKRLIDEFSPQTPRDDQDRRGMFMGVCSNYLCDLSEGDEVRISGPNGKRFLLPVETEEHDYVFLATGTGIAPFRGMIMELLEGPSGPSSREIHLIMGAAYTTDLLYDDCFRALAQQHENFHYHTVISRESQPDGSPGVYIHQYLDKHLDRFAAILGSDRTLMYVCGMAGMQLGVFQLLASKGVGTQLLNIKDEIADIAPEEWDMKQLKRYVRPTHSCMLEVY